MTIADIRKATDTKMDQSLAAFQNNLTKIRTGRANPALPDRANPERCRLEPWQAWQDRGTSQPAKWLCAWEASR